MTKQLELDFPTDDPTSKASAAEGAPPAERMPIPPDGRDPLQGLIDRNFLQYASYVICDRAIPSLDDGLKPVQRRILHSLFEKDDGRFIKVANVVGHCMQYHPHGDASITDALVTLTNRGYLIEGQGNFGNIFTGDRAAAPRYIECRLTDLARKEIFNKALTRFVPSYDGRNQEPVDLPAKLPLLLLLGAEGIAVGLSTRILPHNFRELLEAQIAIVKKEPFSILPDFQQGGLMDVSEYDRGNGRIRVRAVIRRKTADKLAITELPYGATTESLTASIEDAIRKKKVPVKSIDDFTAEQVNIELTLTADARPEKAIQALYAFTGCENAVSCQAFVIHRGRPVLLDVDRILEENTRRLVKILKQELLLRKRNLLEEIHTKTLLQIFVENRIYKQIETCRTYPAVQQAVRDGLLPFADQLEREVTQKDIEMLLGIPIRRISRFDLDRNRKEIAALRSELASVEKHLENLQAYAVAYLKGLLRQHGAAYPRRTRVTVFESIELKKLTARELEIRYDREKGYLGHAVKEGECALTCSSYDKVLLVWDTGVYKVVPPPERLFADKNLVYCARMDRDRVITMVYTDEDEQMPYLKRFRFGGAILNKEYRCAGKDGKILLFSDESPAEIYVKYKPAKRQRVHQQVFLTKDLPVKGVKARGSFLAPKAIQKIATKKPRWWNAEESSPRGVLFDT